MVKFTLEGGATLEIPDGAMLQVESLTERVAAIDVAVGQRLVYKALFPGVPSIEVTEKEIV